MGMAALVLVSAATAATIATDATQHFPGQYFDTRVRESLHRQVMDGWPGPAALLELWRDGGLDEESRVAVLVGGAAFHEPLLLPLYREALRSPSPRLRQAAAYGYRDLIGDRPVDVSGGIDDEAAEGLVRELDLIALTLRRRPLLEIWLQGALANEGRSFPGWIGITLQRPLVECMAAAEKLVGPHDLDLLIETLRLTEDLRTRIHLVKLIEAVTLSTFIVMPADDKQGWGRHVYDTAFGAVENAVARWSAGGCRVDGEAVLRSRMKAMGAGEADPFAVDGCGLWLGVLEEGDPRWWMLAARRLYDCGGPWVELSALDPGTDRDRDLRKRLLKWYEPLLARPGRPVGRR
jgi:hypothetical protein